VNDLTGSLIDHKEISIFVHDVERNGSFRLNRIVCLADTR
jgi:hypothetical protein